MIRELDRLVTTLARYLGDMALAGDFPQGPPGHDPAGGTRAALDARIALRRSAQVLHGAAGSLSERDAGDAHPAAWHLAQAAVQLAAGRDLLHTHFSNDPSTGAQTRTSTWAKVIHSPPVTDALLGEIGGLAAKLAPWMVRLSLESPPDSAMPAVAGLTFHDSGRWLWAAALELETRSHQEPPAGEGRRVLAAIPANLPPAYRPARRRDHRARPMRGRDHHGGPAAVRRRRVRPHRPLVRRKPPLPPGGTTPWPPPSSRTAATSSSAASPGALPASGFTPPSRLTSTTAPGPSNSPALPGGRSPANGTSSAPEPTSARASAR